MLPGTGDLGGLRVKHVMGNRVEFVINNTEGGWYVQCFLTSGQSIHLMACTCNLDTRKCRPPLTSCKCGSMQGHTRSEHRGQKLCHRCTRQVPLEEWEDSSDGMTAAAGLDNISKS